MSKPHLCPKCAGERTVPDHRPATASMLPPQRTCPVCRGEGVLWEAPAVTFDPNRLIGPDTIPKPKEYPGAAEYLRRFMEEQGIVTGRHIGRIETCETPGGAIIGREVHGATITVTASSDDPDAEACSTYVLTTAEIEQMHRDGRLSYTAGGDA
jgi:hypothetical protein